MISIFMNGENKTHQIKTWEICYNNHYKLLELTCHFPSGKRYTLPLSKCEVIPTKEIQDDALLFVDGHLIVKKIEKAIKYGEKYTIIYYQDDNEPDIIPDNRVEIISGKNTKIKKVFDYFKQVIDNRVESANEKNKSIIENIQRQFNKISVDRNMVLYAYCAGINQKRKPPKNFIYPFGINQSQLVAVEKAFSSQISVIEGPPGTGKTQTILNIIANILLQNKSVAILSHTNSAVENIYEKLTKVELDYIVAKLGSSDKRSVFFAQSCEIDFSQPQDSITLDLIQDQFNTLKNYLEAKNKVALIKSHIDELTIEKNYLQQWQRENSIEEVDISKYPLFKKRATKLLVHLKHLAQRRISIKDRIQLFFYYKILRTKFINNWKKRNALFYTIQLIYYTNKLHENNELLKKYQQILEQNKFDELLSNLTHNSMQYLKNHLNQNIDPKETYTAQNYQHNFASFIKRYPIIGSSSHSIINSIGYGSQIDYLIIDEASQQDIIPALLGFSCTKNVIIVGDRKQLPHIPTKLNIPSPVDCYDCEKYSLLDSVICLFQKNIPVTLLKEHYRCHPKIIQFCNKQFYDNQLIPMTEDKGENALILITTALGNHTRNFSNLRELDSIKKVCLEELNDDNTGFIAPYNNQVNLSEEHLPEALMKATTHKFQGKECDNIIFSTVLDKKQSSEKNLNFVDDPCLVNVAVSRAKNRFILVTGNNVFTKNNQSIAALIGYIKYYAKDEQIHDSPVISAFDLLYDEYDKSLETFKLTLNPKDSKFISEQIIVKILYQIFSNDKYKNITFHREILLNQLVASKNNMFDQDQKNYIKNGASVDVVLYSKTDKSPFAAIEVDGGEHENSKQKKRDKLKNEILKQVGIPLLRIKTIESDIENKMTVFIDEILFPKQSN